MQQQRQEANDDELVRQRQEEYRAAQRVAVESILVGRATAEVVEQQGEQLQRAEILADDTQYKLDKAARLLKGMTWTGWAGNLFAANVKAPESLSNANSNSPARSGGAYDSDRQLAAALEKYDELPSECQEAAQAIRNYHANVKVLLQCETEEQKETCVQICNAMHSAAIEQLQELSTKAKLQAYAGQLQSDLELLRKRQVNSQSQINVDAILSSSSTSSPQSPSRMDTHTDRQKEELFGRKPSSTPQPSSSQSASLSTPTKATLSKTGSMSPSLQQQEQMQTEHLQVISACLGELGQIAHSLNRGLDQQRETIDSLDTKSDNVLETSKMVGRRTERLVQAKSWTPVPMVYYATVAIRHADTGKYLAILGGGDVYLMNKFNAACCVFDLHRRKPPSSASGNSVASKIISLRSHSNRKWIGQSFLTGSLTCLASQSGRREEWEVDNMSNTGSSTTTTEDALYTQPTRLLCVSAGWGNGGYLQVRTSSDFAVLIGGSTAAERQAAAQWMFVNQESTAAT